MHVCTSHASRWTGRVGRLPTTICMMIEKQDHDERLAVQWPRYPQSPVILANLIMDAASMPPNELICDFVSQSRKKRHSFVTSTVKENLPLQVQTCPSLKTRHQALKHGSQPS